MKKIFSVIVAFALMLSLLGCGKKDEARPAAETPATASQAEEASGETKDIPKQPAEYDSPDAVQQDVEMFLQAVYSGDSKKCDLVKGERLRKDCLQKTSPQPQSN